jgi:hypothetical protein
MTKLLPLGLALLALTLASGCISYSSTTRTVPAEPAAVVTPVPAPAVVAAPATTTTTLSVR